jgi:hypothetical protein
MPAFESTGSLGIISWENDNPIGADGEANKLLSKETKQILIMMHISCQKNLKI